MVIVLKFGGTSLQGQERVQAAARRVKELARRGDRVVVVVSAPGDHTDVLWQRARECAACPNPRETDALLATGEQMSAALMAMTLEEMDCPAVSLTGYQAGILTDGVYGNAWILGLGNDRIQRELTQGRVVVVTGFQGVDLQGNITTLGRGGSDTTAAALAAFLNAQVCRIYTDVDGIYDRDPRKDSQAVRFSRIGYGAMLALARAGAQVLHERCVETAMHYGVTLQVLSSFREGEGTFVTDIPQEDAQI